MPAWTPNTIRQYFQEFPEIMSEHLWVFQVEVAQDYDPGKASYKDSAWEKPRTIEDPKGFVPTLPVQTADYRKDSLVSLLLLLWRMAEPRHDVHVSITTPALLKEAGLKHYTYSEFPPLVDAVCPLCGQVDKVSAGEELIQCECGYREGSA